MDGVAEISWGRAPFSLDFQDESLTNTRPRFFYVWMFRAYLHLYGKRVIVKIVEPIGYISDPALTF